jgi:exoribonuclease-2
VLHKNQAGIVRSISDGKLLVEISKGEEVRKLRDKDVSLVHPGPLSALPSARTDGDFETAFEMLFGDTADSDANYRGKNLDTDWKELSELVFGDYSPSSALACVLEAQAGKIFRLADGAPIGISKTEREASLAKAEEKNREAKSKEDFILGMRAAVRGSKDFTPTQSQKKYISELENFALGQTERTPLAKEIGVVERIEGVHKALVDSGIWGRRFNPWPQRAGCTLKPPKSPFPDKEIPGGPERIDLRPLESLAIDNAWSKDPDDAIAFDGNRIWVHIADPSAFFAPDSEVDQEAISRGATLYLPETIVPMLPESALPVLGLGLSPTSVALSFGIRIGEDGHIEDTVITPSIVKVSRLSYAQADELLAAGNPTLTALDSLARKRKVRRVQNGAVDIELPEVSIKAKEEEIRFVQVEKTRSADIVKECMLLASEAVGRWAWDKGIPVPYSSQEAPQLPKGVAAVDQGEVLPSIQFLRRKGMKASIVGPECLAHQGLGLSFYCQATSPLRRYQDLLAHYQIRASLRSQKPLSSEEISRRCLLANQAASLTRQAERDSRHHWITVYLSENPGWEGDAIVLEAREREAIVLFPALGLETMLRTRTPCEPDKVIRVRLVRADIANLDLSFELI